MTTDTSSSVVPLDHFAHIAPKWSHFGPPLRPYPDDTAVVQRIADTLDNGSRVVVLGLTPEIIGCTWPDETRLLAVDHSVQMISALWPPAKGPANAEVIQADWCAMPIPSGTADLVVGDGCYVLLSHPEGFESLTSEIHRVLKPGGRFVIRVFLRPDQPETVADIAQTLAGGSIGSVHALKLRLLAALHGTSGEGTLLDDVWQAWSRMPPLPDSCTGVQGWTVEEIVGIASYRGMQARYYLPTLAEARISLGSQLLELECARGQHELSDCCPTLVWMRQG